MYSSYTVVVSQMNGNSTNDVDLHCMRGHPRFKDSKFTIFNYTCYERVLIEPVESGLFICEMYDVKYTFKTLEHSSEEKNRVICLYIFFIELSVFIGSTMVTPGVSYSGLRRRIETC